jgi:hypothetical protein
MLQSNTLSLLFQYIEMSLILSTPKKEMRSNRSVAGVGILARCRPEDLHDFDKIQEPRECRRTGL